jgi:hypothetical protein
MVRRASGGEPHGKLKRPGTERAWAIERCRIHESATRADDSLGTMVTLPANEAVRGALLALSVGVGFVVIRLFTRKIAKGLPDWQPPAFGDQLSQKEMKAALEAMLADPATTAKDRAWAERRLSEVRGTRSRSD